MDTKTQKVMFSSESDEWETPQDFYDKLNKKHRFTLDACSTHLNHKCEKYYTAEDDGLSKSWKGETVFVNPPYSQIEKWLKKAHDELCKHRVQTVMLIPARTDTKYWHDYVMTDASVIYFVKGRLKFYNKFRPNAFFRAPFPSVVVVFGGLRFAPGPHTATMGRT